MSNNNGQKKNAQPKPAPVLQIRITLLSNGVLDVRGFPAQFEKAMTLMNEGQLVVAREFIKAGMENRLNDDLVMDAGKILAPKKNLFVPA